MSPKSICIIPARGGSKRISKKNIKDFLGKPIISYSIKAAIDSEIFDEIFVSTDSDEIAKISRDYGANTSPLRSKENSGDFATTADVIEEVLGYPNFRESSFEYICCLYPTAPFVTKEILIKALKTLRENIFNSVFPIAEYDYPIQRALERNAKSGETEFVNNQYLNSRSQDLDLRFHDTGQFYFLNTKSFLNEKKLFTKPSHGILLDNLCVQDIDSLTDWKLAELKYKLVHGNS